MPCSSDPCAGQIIANAAGGLHVSLAVSSSALAFSTAGLHSCPYRLVTFSLIMTWRDLSHTLKLAPSIRLTSVVHLLTFSAT
jgi:hypothetical protein